MVSLVLNIREQSTNYVFKKFKTYVVWTLSYFWVALVTPVGFTLVRSPEIHSRA